MHSCSLFCKKDISCAKETSFVQKRHFCAKETYFVQKRHLLCKRDVLIIAHLTADSYLIGFKGTYIYIHTCIVAMLFVTPWIFWTPLRSHMYIYTYTYLYMYIHICTYMYTYIHAVRYSVDPSNDLIATQVSYIYIHIYTYMYVYVYTSYIHVYIPALQWCYSLLNTHFFTWWVLYHCTGFARLVCGRLRVHRAFVYSNWFVCYVCFCSSLLSLTLLLSFLWTFCTASPARWECL